jgi:hypothetical protein
MHKTSKLLTAGAIALVLSGGVAAAATGSLPTQAGPGLTTAGDHTGFEVPASHDDHPTGTSSESSDATESTDAADDNTDSSGQPDNHGAAVSDVARNTDATGSDKGAAVSAAAQDNTGLNDHAATPGTVPDDAADQASDGSAHASGHGRP